jgi:hypothetical protein
MLDRVGDEGAAPEHEEDPDHAAGEPERGRAQHDDRGVVAAPEQENP